MRLLLTLYTKQITILVLIFRQQIKLIGVCQIIIAEWSKEITLEPNLYKKILCFMILSSQY